MIVGSEVSIGHKRWWPWERWVKWNRECLGRERRGKGWTTVETTLEAAHPVSQ